MEKIRSFNERQKAQLTFYSLASAHKQRPMVCPASPIGEVLPIEKTFETWFDVLAENIAAKRGAQRENAK